MEFPLEWSDHKLPDGIIHNLRYTSCIRVHGKPILPPLLTSDRRKEMLQLRRAAVLLEEKLSSRRLSSSSSDGIARLNSENCSTPSRPMTLDLRGQAPKSNRIRESIEHQLAMRQSESDNESDCRGWSPLQTDVINNIKLKVGTESDSTQDTPETITASPKVVRQNSYTVLNPSPALIDYLDSQQQERVKSGRKTWDFQQARSNWTRDEDSDSDFSNSVIQKRSHCESASSTPRHLQVPSTVPLNSNRPEPVQQNPPVPSVLEEKIGKLSVMMMSLKLRHEQQRRELEEKQRVEHEQFQTVLTRKIFDLVSTETLPRVTGPNKDYNTRTSRSWHADVSPHLNEANLLKNQDSRQMRPVSARDPPPTRRRVADDGRRSRARSVDRYADSVAQDTDIDVSFQEDFSNSKTSGRRGGGDDWYESYSMSSRSSTISNDTVPESYRNGSSHAKITTHASQADWHRCNKAAAKIGAGAKGYLTRRLMRTEYVNSLFRSLRDTISIAQKLKDTDDLGSSDLDFMVGLTRQINSNWDAIYEVFLRKDPREQMQIIASDRARVLSARGRSKNDSGKMISSATMKSISRRQMGMSTSFTCLPRSGSFSRSCFKMSNSLSGALPPQRP